MPEPVENLWAKHDAASNYRAAETPRKLRFAFYGRMSTNLQDEDTSRGWQRSKAQSLVAGAGGEIVVDFFDADVSRSIPWANRPEASQILAALANPNRGWDAIVVGEAQRSFYATQFGDVAPLFHQAGVEVWAPELGGAFNPKNDGHHMLMSIAGSMSRGERQKSMDRVKSSMAVQVQTEGRFQGGRPPHGYKLVDLGPHPNKRDAARGVMLRNFAVNPDTAPDVERIYERYLAGDSIRQIARDLNVDGVLCPSGYSSLAARNKRADGWQPSAVEKILSNPRYTGYAVFGEHERVEVLISEHVADGYRTIRKRSEQAPVRSSEQAFEAIIPLETYLRVQEMRGARRTRNVGDRKGAEHGMRRPAESLYLFRGLIRCSICGRRLESFRRDPAHPERYYRCVSRGLVPGSEIAEAHPKVARIRESDVSYFVNRWLGELFDPDHIEDTIAQMLGTRAGEDDVANQREKKLADQVTKLERQRANFYNALGLGGDAGEILSRIKNIDAEIAEAQSGLGQLRRTVSTLTAASLRQSLSGIGDVVTEVLSEGDTAQLQVFYEALNLSLEFDPIEKALDGAVLLSTLPDTDVPCGKRPYRWWDSNPHALSDKAF